MSDTVDAFDTASSEPLSGAVAKEQVKNVPLKRWLRAFDGYNLATNTVLTSAIWVVYLAAHGYSPFAIGLFEMTFHVAKFVAEVPTGIFADLLGRRKSLVVYCMISACESLLFLIPTTPLLILAFTLAGIAFAFRGGANEALLWTLAGYAKSSDEAEDQTRVYSKLVSRMVMVGLIGEVVGTACGGYLGNILQVLPFIGRACVIALSIVPLLMLPEQRATSTGQVRPQALRHLGIGLRAVWRSPALIVLLLVSGLTESCWQTIYFYYQLYLHDQGFPLSTIGIIVALSMGSNFVFTAFAPWLMRHMSERILVTAFVVLQMLGLALMSWGNAWTGLFGYLVLFQAALAILYPALSTYINQRSPEAQRATVLSLQTGLFSAAMIVLFPLFGLGLTNASYATVYLWTLIALIIGSGTIVLLYGVLRFLRRA
jgi:MFS family permease